MAYINLGWGRLAAREWPQKESSERRQRRIKVVVIYIFVFEFCPSG